MSGAGADGPFEVAVEPHNDSYDPDDDGWRDQVATLYADLDAQVDTVRRGRPVEGAYVQLIGPSGDLGHGRTAHHRVGQCRGVPCRGGLLACLAGA